jgi:hypothetical protein
VPVKRRLHKGREHRITDDAISAWRAGDYLALHRALGMKPWEPSPLPLDLTPLGCGQPTQEGAAAAGRDGPLLWNQSLPRAQELQRELYRVAGEPGVER